MRVSVCLHLEAMAHGTPVVTSNVSSLPEVVGNAAVLVHPENVFEIMRALHRVLLDQPLRDKMKERSYRQAAKFSWEKSVRRIMDAYREVLNPKGNRNRPASTAPRQRDHGRRSVIRRVSRDARSIKAIETESTSLKVGLARR